LALGAACRYHQECVFNAYCDQSTHTCQASLPSGAPCQDSSQCQDGNRCHFSNTTQSYLCTAPFSLPLGAFCQPERNPFHFLCQPGLACSLDNVCVEEASTQFAQSCSLSHPGTCRAPSECRCNQFVGDFQCTGFYAPAVSDANTLLQLHQCLVQSQCKSSEKWSSGTCADRHCKSLREEAVNGMCPQLTTALGECAHIPLYSRCLPSDEDDEDDFSDAAAVEVIFGVIFVVVLITAAAILLYRWYRRRQLAAPPVDYQPVAVELPDLAFHPAEETPPVSLK
jgi:hypothetical protein